MTYLEFEKEYIKDRPVEPYSEDDCPSDWARIAKYAEDNLQRAFNLGYSKCHHDFEKENAVLKERNIKDCKNFNKAVEKISEQLNRKHCQINEAKDLLLRFIELKNKPCAVGNSVNMLLYENICAEAKQFLKETE